MAKGKKLQEAPPPGATVYCRWCGNMLAFDGPYIVCWHCDYGCDVPVPECPFCVSASERTDTRNLEGGAAA